MIYRFEDFAIDTARHELTEAGEVVAVEPQVLQLLIYLIEQRDRLVSKDDIVHTVWNGRFVSDAALNSRIKSARRVVNDDGRTQRVIKTMHRVGYRFVAQLHEDPPTAADPSNPTPSDRQPTVAVLPFANLSGDADQNYFANAITSDIANNLSLHRWLAVVARNAQRAYETEANVTELLREQLGVDYVVEGSVRRADNRIRVVAQLGATESGRNQWSETYERNFEDVFDVQDDIVRTIVARIEPEISSAERRRVLRQPSRDLAAWDCYHLAIDHFFRFTAADNLKAQQLLQRSRELDPAFGEAHAWWAYSVVLGMVYWDVDASEALLDEALAATDQALQIDDRNATFFALKARVQLARGDYTSAVAENELAIELNPTLASAHCGLADSLAYEGRYDDAIARFEHVIELSTNDPQRWAFFTYGALALIFKGDYARAVRWCEKAQVLPNRQYWTLAHKMVAHAYLGDDEQVALTRAALLREKPEFNSTFASAKLFYLRDEEQKRHYLEGLARCALA